MDVGGKTCFNVFSFRLMDLHGRSPFIDYSGGMSPASLVSEQINEQELATATAYLRSLAASQQCAGVDTRIEVCYGLPVQQLLACARAPEVDLVVLCSHGRSGFARWVLGSVAHALVHQCTRPLLVLRQNRAFSVHTGPLRTLVPLDGSSLAEAALSPAAALTSALAAPGQGALHLSQVVKIFPTSADEGFISELNEEARQRAETYVRQVQLRLMPQATNLQISLTHEVPYASDVAGALINLAEHGSEHGEQPHAAGGLCDLIAISTHGRGGLERWIMGSVAQRLLNATTLPMLIVRPSDEG
jgi:nucleotide-binding universal stress UspA family protein